MIVDVLDHEMVDRAYRVTLDASGRLQWIERVDGRDVVYHSEPGSGVWRRAVVRFFSWLPIEWL